MKKRYSILVREIGSGREIELCQVDSNPRRVAEAAGMKLLRTSSSGRQYRIKRYDWIRIVDNGEASIIAHSRAERAMSLLLPFVTYCGRFPGICPLTDRSSIADIYCYRCSCIAPGNITVPSSW